MITIAQFQNCFHACFGATTVKAPRRLAIALSGGVDSMCLAYLLSQYKQVYEPSLELHSITIDHGYRSDSEIEAQKVAQVVQNWGILPSVSRLKYSCNPAKISNFEEVARTMRYAEFERFCRGNNIEGLLVAHNLDDQIETFIQRLRQNSSIFGLAGLKRATTLPVATNEPNERPIPLFRPLLQFPKSELISTCIANKIQWFEDSTNQDANLTERNFWRSELKKPDDESVINRDQFLQTFLEVETVVNELRKKVKALKLHVFGTEECEYARNGTLSFQIQYSVLSNLSAMVFSRFLFQILHPISASRDYHWMYAKLERHAVPRIMKHFVVSQNRVALRLTYLNILWNIERIEDILHFHFERQPIPQNEYAHISTSINPDGKSTLFDNRFWIRLKIATKNKVSVEPYDPKRHKKIIRQAFPELKNFSNLSKSLKLTPIVIAQDIMAVPVLDKVKANIPADVEVQLKANLFTNS